MFLTKNKIMNKNIDLTKILKDCPEEWKFYSSIYGDVAFRGIENGSEYPVKFSFIDKYNSEKYSSVTEQGLYASYCNGECTFFPSKEQRDWSKFTSPWYKKEKFDPNTLQPFDKVLVRDASSQNWSCGLFSHIVVFDKICKYNIGEILYTMCIPYNDDTKYLIGTKNEVLIILI